MVLFFLLLSITAIKNIKGEITGYLAIAKDISEEKEAELNLITVTCWMNLNG
jgi:PAS domain S-box-containing protein